MHSGGELSVSHEDTQPLGLVAVDLYMDGNVDEGGPTMQYSEVEGGVGLNRWISSE